MRDLAKLGRLIEGAGGCAVEGVGHVGDEVKCQEVVHILVLIAGEWRVEQRGGAGDEPEVADEVGDVQRDSSRGDIGVLRSGRSGFGGSRRSSAFGWHVCENNYNAKSCCSIFEQKRDARCSDERRRRRSCYTD